MNQQVIIETNDEYNGKIATLEQVWTDGSASLYIEGEDDAMTFSRFEFYRPDVVIERDGWKGTLQLTEMLWADGDKIRVARCEIIISGNGSDETYNEIKAELESHPTWITKQKRIEENEKATQELYERRNSNPCWCWKCRSYCCGDCEAND